MGSIIRKLWKDPQYFRKSLTFIIASAATLLPVLPLGEFGDVGYWLSKVALPLAVALGATTRGSGLTESEAAKLRALIPKDEVLKKQYATKAEKITDG